MTIQVYPYNEQEEKALLDFLKSRHYNYKSTDEQEIADPEFLNEYNRELDEAEAQIDAGDYLTHDDVMKFFTDKKSASVEIKWSKAALYQLDKALDFIVENGFTSYAAKLEMRMFARIESLTENYKLFPTDKYKKNNDGSYHAFEIDEYRVSYRVENSQIKIIRIRHTSRRTLKY